MEIDLTQVAKEMLARSEGDIEDGWTNNLVDILEELYGLETALSQEVIKVQNAKLFYCCLCNRLSGGVGNNPAPLKDEGRCCDQCNTEKVVPARIALAKEAENA